MSKEGIDRLELDAEHFKSYGLDSGALYNRIVKYLEELKERRSEAKSLEVKNGEKRQGMTDADLIAAMRRNSVETGSMPCLGCGYEHNCGIKGCAILRAAADSIESLSVAANKTLDDNPPLTLEELRAMERLTIDTKVLFCDISQCRETPGGSFCEDGYCDQRRVYERLREYERICDLDGLNELVKAKREGRLVVLPCKTWETVYGGTKGNPLCSAADSEKSAFLHAKKPEAALKGENDG